MGTSCVRRLRQIVSLMPISLMLCALFVGLFPGVASASPGEGTLALEPQTIEVEKNEETDVCPEWPFFDVRVMITDVTDLSGIVVSVHWDPAILNCTKPDGTPGFTPGDLIPPGIPGIGWQMVWDLDAGNMSEAANGLPGPPLRTIHMPNWGWVFTLTFEYLGPSPAPGEPPIETDIIIVNQPEYAMTTCWQESMETYHNFTQYPEPVPGKPWIVSTCHFHYEAVRDVAIVGVAPSKTVVGAGYPLSIDVTAENQGGYSENFNATAYANTTIIATVTNITLAIGNSTTITFTWKTTGVPYGKYIVSAYATQVPNETDTSDNTFIDGTIIVTIPGDVNGDYKVSYRDLFHQAAAWGSRPGDPHWDPNCDVDGNGHVGWEDLFTVAAYYGKTV